MESTCGRDSSQSLSGLVASVLRGRDRFGLRNRPVVSTLRVSVDGVERPAAAPDGTVNWRNAFEANAIVFDPNRLPPPGSGIEVAYSPDCL